ncbi:SLC13 family permease [Actinomyces polynesiensis]|uniref:SLC13 family permease n=1 Tax=Actinomyces polynesiensis TaxID=1325934 RepID=UPI0005BCE9E8|nr:SLC13 family permease [Actinomyces polynesiensis]
MRLGLLGLVLILLGGAAWATGLLPAADAVALGQRVWPVLLFALAVTVVAELAASAGVFVQVASRVALLARGRTTILWLLVVGLAILSTVFLSLDTTAVLLTPVVVLLAVQAHLRARAFALTTVWLANTASLWLPVSNLTNLLAAHRLGEGGVRAFVELMWLPALVATVVPVALLFLVFRGQLSGDFSPTPPPAAPDPLLLRICAATVGLLLPMLVLMGGEPWIPACAAAVVIVAAFAWRRPSALRWSVLPVPLVLFASGLFLVVGTAHSLGATAPLGVLAGEGEGPVALLRLSAVGMLGANGVNNLPAYLALEPLADSPLRVGALLIGVNAGPLVTPWGSLATLLWHQRLQAMGVSISWRAFILLGVVAAPLTVGAASAGLWLASR